MGGRFINIEVQNTNILGASVFVAYVDAYALDRNGKVVPQFRAEGKKSLMKRKLSRPVLPMSTFEHEFMANFKSKYSYFWRVTMKSEKAIRNESYMFFRVYK